ncbi:ABC transporter permease family protein [Frigidibacter oleivorans]|uniref:FtsX-like permease family protein n=1 Tax=Frigidibacter oleivorans TaxID=2487129 RepID=UPI000F8F7B49|nr:FtsX-like permease family protein [Frigidibacter oleivorans]
MREIWAGLSPDLQDALIALALLAPGLAAGALVLRGLAPFGLVRAMLRRFAWVNLLFVLLIAVSVGLGVGLVAQERGLRQGSARAAEGFDLIVAAPGSEVTVMLAAVYLQPSDMALLTGAQYDEIATAEGVAFAAPIAFGDSVDGAPVVGTTPDFVTHLAGDLAEGSIFATEAEAVAGAFAPVGPGDSFTPAHGHGAAAEGEAHAGFSYTVTGRMAPTGSPWDRAVLVPAESVWSVHGLANGHAPGDDRIGPPYDPVYMPGTPAVLVRATELWGNYALKSRFTRSDMMAFFPGTVLAQLHGLMGEVRAAMSALATLTQVLVTLSVLIGLVILVRLIARSLAVLRALGAPVRFVFAVVWSYSAALILTGAAAGLVLGLGAARALAALITVRTDVLVTARLGWSELHLVAGFVSLTLILALLPAWAAIRRPVLADLRN